MPIPYGENNSWDTITNAIYNYEGSEGKEFWRQIEEYKLGQTNESKIGYQYNQSDNFPHIYQKVDKPTKSKSNLKKS